MGTDLSIALIKPPMYLSEYYTRISRLKISKFKITRLLTFNYQLIIYEYWILIEIIIFISQSYYNEFLNFIKRQIRFLRRRSNYFSLVTRHFTDEITSNSCAGKVSIPRILEDGKFFPPVYLKRERENSNHPRLGVGAGNNPLFRLCLWRRVGVEPRRRITWANTGRSFVRS